MAVFDMDSKLIQNDVTVDESYARGLLVCCGSAQWLNGMVKVNKMIMLIYLPSIQS